jgi:hypothetical protein
MSTVAQASNDRGFTQSDSGVDMRGHVQRGRKMVTVYGGRYPSFTSYSGGYGGLIRHEPGKFCGVPDEGLIQLRSIFSAEHRPTRFFYLKTGLLLRGTQNLRKKIEIRNLGALVKAVLANRNGPVSTSLRRFCHWRFWS